MLLQGAMQLLGGRRGRTTPGFHNQCGVARQSGAKGEPQSQVLPGLESWLHIDDKKTYL